MIALYVKRDETVGQRLNKIGPVSRKEISKINDEATKANLAVEANFTDTANEHFLLARLYVAKFLIANKPKDIEFAEAELAEAGKREAKGKAAEQRRQVLMKIIDGLEGDVGGVVAQISSTAIQMQSAAQTMSAIAEETSSQSATVAAASEGSATNVQTVASATEELSSSILEITHQVSESSRIS